MSGQSLQLSGAELKGMGFKDSFVEQFLWAERTIRQLVKSTASTDATVAVLALLVAGLEANKVERIFGQATIELGNTDVTVVATAATPDSVVFLQLVDVDATLTIVVPAAGTGDFTITGNAAATADTLVNWLLINP